MSTVLKYGGKSWPIDSVVIDRRIDTLMSRQKYPYAETHTLTVSGSFTGDGPAALVALGKQFELALGRPFQDLRFEADDGTLIYSLPNSTSTDGVKITSYHNPPNPGHLATAYYFEFTATATYQYSPDLVGGIVILEFRESLRVQGGGPRYAFVECMNAKPQKFQLTPRTVARATQSGTLRTLGGYGTFPPPLYPADEMYDQTQKQLDTGRNEDGVTEYAINWQYEFATGDLITI